MSVVPGTGIITPALTLLGVTTQGETPSTAETADGVRFLNSMWSNWNSDDLTSLPITVSGSWGSGVAADFLGVTSTAFASYTGPAPARIRSATVTLSARQIPLTIRNLEWYWAQPYKLLQATGPTDIVYHIGANDSAAGGNVYVWPVPSGSVTISLVFTAAFPNLADATTAVTLDQYALQASIFNLAVNIGNAYGVNVPAEVKKEAADSLARLRNYSASTFNADPNPPQGQALQPPAQPTP